MKKLAYLCLLVMGLLFTGCGGGSDEGSCRFEVQQNLDTGNFAAVISELSNANSVCKEAYNSNEWQLDLGAAYMGQAGLGVTDVLTLLGAEDSSGSSSFSQLISSVNKKQGPTALADLGSASVSYAAALNGVSCSSPNLSTSQKDICLYIGLAETMRASSTINVLVPNIDALFDNTNPGYAAAKEEMTASMCALQFITPAGNCTEADATVPTGSDIVFTYSDGSTRTFSDITITMDAAPNTVYHKLGTASAVNPGTTVVTSGYCDASFNQKSATYSGGLYACPANEDPNGVDQDIGALLVDSLNNGLDAISGALSGDEALQTDINNYKAEIDTNNDGVSLTEIQVYLKSL